MPYTLWRVRLISKQARTEACAGCSVHKGPRPCQGPLATDNNRTSRLKYCMLTASCEILFYSFHKEEILMFKQKNYAGRRQFILNKKIYVSLKNREQSRSNLCQVSLIYYIFKARQEVLHY